MTYKRISVDGRMRDVLTFDEYVDQKDYINPEYTAVIIPESQSVYPIRGKTDTRPGMYPGTAICKFKQPDESEVEEYNVKNIIDLDNASSLKELIEKQDKVRSAERHILTTVDNKFIPPTFEQDTPEMVGLKQAVTQKEIDIYKYAPRFGDNFNNDIRLFKKTGISMDKLKSISNALDIKLTLILEDKDQDVPNPMGEPVVVNLLGNSDKGDEL